MATPAKTKRANLDPARIVFGCGGFGGIGSIPELIGRGEDEPRAFELLDEAVAYGITQFDTANTYANGLSEEILGRWIRKQEAGLRDRLRVSTKVGNPNSKRVGAGPLSREDIAFHLHQSLTRLGISCIDVYYIHQPDPETPLEETAEALSRALRLGKIACVGLSNVDAEYVRNFLAVCDSALRGAVRFVQNEFHFLDFSDRNELLPLVQQNGLNYAAFSPLAGGLLTGKYRSGAQAPKGSRVQLRPNPYERFLNEGTFAVISDFVEAAKSEGITPSERALRFVLDEPGVSAALIGPRKTEHIKDIGLTRLID